jgi:putative transposase
MPLMGWFDFLTWCAARVNYYNDRPHRSLPKLIDRATGQKRHATPNEQWQILANNSDAAIGILTDEQARPLFRPQEMRTITRGEISLFGNRYFSAALAEYNGVRLPIGYDIHDASRVWVYTDEGHLLAIADLNGNDSQYFAVPVIEQARDKRAARRAKLHEAHLDEIEAERRGRGEIGNIESMRIGFKTLTADELNSGILAIKPIKPITPINDHPASPQLLTPPDEGWRVPDTPDARFIEFERLSALAIDEVDAEAREWMDGYSTTGEYRGQYLLKKNASLTCDHRQRRA